MFRFDNSVDGMQIAARAGAVYNPACDRCVARIEKGALYGGVIYQAYTGASMSIHMAGFRPNWCNRDMVWVAFHYPFVQLGVKKLFGQVGIHKPEILKIDIQLGFKIEAVIKDVYPEGDMALLSMYKDDCRWLKVTPRTIASQKGSRHGW
jgi:hypothetical protein